MGLFFNREKKPKKSKEEKMRERIENSKADILNKKEVTVQVAYTKSGVNEALLASQVFGKGGAFIGSLNEGDIGWNPTKILLQDKGLYVQGTGQVLFYSDIVDVVIGDKSFLSRMMTIVAGSGDNLVLRSGEHIVRALKEVIELNIAEDTSVEDVLKYAELFEKGLLTEDEFMEFKSRLLK